MRKTITLVLIGILLTSCNNDDYVPIKSDLDENLRKLVTTISEQNGLSYFILPQSDDYLKIPQDPKNPITRQKVTLGKLLLHETASGGNPKIDKMKGTYSCASCHQVAAGFSSGLRQGVGECGIGFGMNGDGRFINKNVPIDSVDIQPVRSPTLLNVAYQDVMLWNGQFGGTGTNEGTESNWGKIEENFLRLQGVEIQAIKGQGAHRLKINSDFVNTFGYKELFDLAFSDIPEKERYTTKNAGLAIAAYERTLLANKSPWQEWLRGDYDAMNTTEKRGAIIFFGKAKCYECHTGPALNDRSFHAFGMGDFDNSAKAVVLKNVDFDNVKKGRGGFTKNAEDNYKFKTPTLYNLIDNNFYGHGGTFTSVRDVIVYKNKGIPQSKEVTVENLAIQFGNINLTNQEIDDLTVFIERSLRDPDLTRYVPKAIQSGLCFPTNDIQSQKDLGCK
ncbi:cytochrome-c peroxidase [Aquimarina longa]|uniref:cytochrome-c peroxidase n=1 Tax=Aquimarina longa TaxID=1080221 RepID=UPI000785945C|nr:cytochrome c peroxidase [Aquimarina longa]